MKQLLLSFLFSALTTASFATSIVIVVTPQYILIGTDSKRLLLNAAAQVTSEQSVCKIRSAGKYCYAFAGLTTASATSFSADSIVAFHLAKALHYAAALEAIQRDVTAALYKELTYQEQHHPEVFDEQLKNDSPLLELVVLSLQNGKPQVQIVGFELEKSTHWRIKSYASERGEAALQQRVYFMGAYNKMEQYLGEQKNVASPEALIEQLIQAQAKATPTSVGAPVHLAKYSATGIEWIK